jgi:hypothetical protein
METVQMSDRSPQAAHPPKPGCRSIFCSTRPRREEIRLLWPSRAQPLDKRWFDRVGLRALTASAQLVHQTANA